MEEITVQPQSTQPTKSYRAESKRAYLTCFITGCVFAVIAIAWFICFYAFLSHTINNSGTDNLIGAAVVVMALLLFAFASIINSIIAAICTGLGILWNKIAGSIVLSVVATILLTLLITFACLFYA